MTASLASGKAPVAKHDVARGAATVALSRLGAVIEVITQPIYTWLFGIPAYGLYVVAWSTVNLAENILDLAFTSALQRLVPRADNEEHVHSLLKLALLIGVLPSIGVALGVCLAAEPLSRLLNAAPEDREQLALAIGLFAWALPLWTFIEIATSAVRARHAFGPEIRLRLFWEQIVRLAIALLAFGAGFGLLGLFVAHFVSLAVTAALSLRLVGRYYDLRLLYCSPISRAHARALLGYGLALLPGNIIRRALSDLPPVVLNTMLPGASGATAAGLYGIARKVSTLPQIVRQTFSYVLAPLAATQARHDISAIQPLYIFATRLSVALVIPISAALILLGNPILSLFAPEATQALPLLIVLVAGRTIEAGIGPAGPVLDILGHRKWLLANSASGFLTWLVLSTLLVERYGGLGMAFAVSGGIVVPALLALVQLRVANRLNVFSLRLIGGIGAGLASAAVLALIDRFARPFGSWIESAVVLLLLPAALWIGLRLGLSTSDRKALGGLAVRLRLLKV